MNPIEQSFKFDLTSVEEIITYIKTLKNKSNGPFSISNKPLTFLINLTPSKAKFPDFLKIGKIFPIHKKNCKTVMLIIDQYRSYPKSVKFLKKLFMIDFLWILKITISFVNTSLD